MPLLKHRRVRLVVALAASCLVPQPVTATGQTPGAEPRALPIPTGPFGVGRVTVHWTDRSRTEVAPPGGGPRELMVDVWYPAESAGWTAATYMNPDAFGQAPSAERLKGYLRAAYESVKAGLVRTHSVEAPPFARKAKRSPVLIFSHGGGEARETYTAQLEDLASHGYVVAAITHTYDAVLTVFPGGRHATLLPGRWPRPTVSTMRGLPPSQEASRDRLRWWADDIRFVLDELTRQNRDAASLPSLVGHLDLSRVGAFGHSAGGLAAAHACQIDARLRACLNQDGLSARAPYYPDAGGWGMDQAFMLIVREARTERPTDEELAKMNMSRAEVEDLLARLTARQQMALENTGKGSYRVTLEAKRTSHADFGDLPLLQAQDAAEAEARARVLNVVRNYTRAFFDKTLRGMKVRLLDAPTASEFVTSVERFGPARKARPRKL